MHSGTKKFDVPLYFDRPTFFVDRCRTLEFKPNRKKNDKAKSTFKSIIEINKVDCHVAKNHLDLVHHLLEAIGCTFYDFRGQLHALIVLVKVKKHHNANKDEPI